MPKTNLVSISLKKGKVYKGFHISLKKYRWRPVSNFGIFCSSQGVNVEKVSEAGVSRHVVKSVVIWAYKSVVSYVSLYYVVIM